MSDDERKVVCTDSICKKLAAHDPNRCDGPFTPYDQSNPGGSMSEYTRNPVVLQDLVAELNRKFESTRDVLFPPQRQIYEHIAELTAGFEVADVGCGLGIGTNMLRGFGYDISPKHVAFAKLVFDRSFYVHDITTGSVGPFDTVVALEIIEHVEETEKAVKNLKASCKDTLYLSTPNRNNPGIGKTRAINDHHVKEYTPDEMLEFFPNAIIRHPISWAILPTDTEFTPLVYEWAKPPT